MLKQCKSMLSDALLMVVPFHTTFLTTDRKYIRKLLLPTKPTNTLQFLILVNFSELPTLPFVIRVIKVN